MIFESEGFTLSEALIKQSLGEIFTYQLNKTLTLNCQNLFSMQFDKGDIYHVYNRGNNSQPIFFNYENYLFFLQKLKSYIIPFADILAWCLMPNHFHLMVYVNEMEVEVAERSGANEGFTLSEILTNGKAKRRTLNDSIGVMLRSYTRAIQKQQNITGSIFQKNTKAICLTEISGITPSWFQVEYCTVINIIDPEKEYAQICFNYIHENPVNAHLVKKPHEWEFSSYQDYSGKRKGKLINRERAKEFGLKIL